VKEKELEFKWDGAKEAPRLNNFLPTSASLHISVSFSPDWFPPLRASSSVSWIPNPCTYGKATTAAWKNSLSFSSFFPFYDLQLFLLISAEANMPTIPWGTTGRQTRVLSIQIVFQLCSRSLLVSNNLHKLIFFELFHFDIPPSRLRFLGVFCAHLFVRLSKVLRRNGKGCGCEDRFTTWKAF